VRVVVGRHAAGAHDMVIYEADGTRGVDLHLELPADMPLAEADDVTRRITADLRREFPRLGPIQIHVDPVRPPRRPAPAVHIDLRYIADRLAELAKGIPGLRRVEDVSARGTRDGLWIICRAVMDRRLTVREAHDRGRELARQAQASMPGIHRLTVRAQAERGEDQASGTGARGSGAGGQGPGKAGVGG
jgi:divalent metal cation (Fe/Co/Zn/Cd) transporter